MKKIKQSVLVFSSFFLLSGCAFSVESNASLTQPSSYDEQSIPSESKADENSSSILTSYTIVFDLDGGTSPSYKGEVTVDAWSLASFFFDCKKEGYHFRGWSYNDKQVFDEEGNLLFTPELASRMVFKAIFRQDVRVRISLSPADAGSAEGEGYYPYSSSVALSATPNDGYLFDGWYDADGILLSSKADYSHKVGEEDVEFEARFKGQPFALTVSSNSEEHGAVIINPTSANVSSDYLPEQTKEISYTSTVKVAAYSKTEDVPFLGWYDGTGTLLSENAVYTFTMPKSAYALMAKWDYFGIDYHLNGGVQNPNNPTHVSTSSETALFSPSRDYYDFAGWYFDEEMTKKAEKIPAGTMEEIHLYAKWTAISYEISYELNGGSNAENPSAYTVEDEINFLPASKDGYSFVGWYLDSDSLFSEAITALPLGSHGDITLYAKWEAVDYEVIYVLGENGVNGEGNPSSYNIESAFTLSDPSRPGYTFAGWNDGETNITAIEPGRTGDLTLTALWKADLNVFSLSSEDETKGKASLVAGEGYSGEEMEVRATPEEGYLFRGWYSDGTLVSEESSYSFSMPAEDYSLEARFWTQEERKEALYGVHPSFNADKSRASFGLYPQSRVSDETKIAALKEKSPESNGWYLLDETYYAKLEASPAEEGLTFADGTEVEDGETYYFSCSPVEWFVILEEKSFGFLESYADKGFYTFFSTSIIDAYAWEKLYADYSELSSWLNSSVFNSCFAFGYAEIQTVEAPFTFSTVTYVNGQRKILVTEDTKTVYLFLPLKHDAYMCGFGDDQAKPTDYAIANGLEYRRQTWRCWTSTSSSADVYCMDTLPSDWDLHQSVNRKHGIRPALKVKIDQA